jgi:hypothetical protein
MATTKLVPSSMNCDPLTNANCLQIDTARLYAFGTSEEYLGKLNWQKRNLIMDTKHYPRSVMLTSFIFF